MWTGSRAAAKEYLCGVNSDIRKAFRDAGEPCAIDKETARPVEVAETPILKEGPPDRCYTTGAGDPIAQRLECSRLIARYRTN
jgi:hypothetical protein